MCPAIPARVIAVEDDMAVVGLGEVIRRASLMLVPETKVGDYVLLHAGFAVQRLNAKEAQETLRLLAEMAAAEEVL